MRNSGLTEREKEILLAALYVGDGHAAIAAHLGISPSTVNTHSKNIRLKMGNHSTLIAALGHAIRTGHLNIDAMTRAARDRSASSPAPGTSPTALDAPSS